MGFVSRKIDECVFYLQGLVFMVYVDDGIIAWKDESKVIQFMQELKQEGFKISDEGSITDYLGVRVTPTDEKTFPSQKLTSSTGKILLWQYIEEYNSYNDYCYLVTVIHVTYSSS